MVDNKIPSWDETEEVSSSSVPTWEDTEDTTPSTLKQFTDSSIGESLIDTAAGGLEGLTFGAADEIGGAVAAGGGKLLDLINNDTEDKRSLTERYRENQQNIEATLNKSTERSPILNTIGNLAGSIPSGIGAGKMLGVFGSAASKGIPSIMEIAKNEGKTKAALSLLGRTSKDLVKASPLIAAESALRSKGKLLNGTNEEQSQVGEDVLGGLAFSAPAMLGMNALTDVGMPAAKSVWNAADDKISKWAGGHPFMRKYGIGMDYGAKGAKPTTETGRDLLQREQITRANTLTDQIVEANENLGKQLGKTIDDAIEPLNIEKPVTKALKALDYSYNMFEDMADNTRGRHIFEKIQSKMNGTVSAREAKNLLDDVDAFYKRFKSIGKPDSTELAIKNSLLKVRNELSDQLKKEVPGYAEQSQRFHEFRTLVPEQILAKDVPVDRTNIFYGDLKDPENKLYKATKELQSKGRAQGSGSQMNQDSFTLANETMKEWEQKELARGSKNPLPFTADEFKNKLQRYSDEAGFLKDIQTVKSPFVSGQNLVSTVGQLGHAGALSTSLLAGRIKKPLVDMSRKAYNLPAEKLNTLASQMQQTKGLKTLGDALAQGLQNGDQAKKNAAIFSILQNPDARLLMEQDNEEEN